MMIAEQKNQLAEAEATKGQFEMARKQMDNQAKIEQAQINATVKMAEMEQKDRHHDDDMAVELTKIEADSNKDVPGALI